MVVTAGDYFSGTNCLDCSYRWRFCHCTIYLYIILNKDLYKNITVIVSGLLIIGLWLDIHVLVIVSASIGLGSVLIPPFARFVNWIWMKLALGLGWINSRILLTLIYFLVLFPIAIISRLFRNDPMELKKGSGDSYYKTRDHRFEKEDLMNTW